MSFQNTLYRKALVFTIALLFIAVSIDPVDSINVEQVDSESTESTAKSIGEPSFSMSYDYVHNLNLGEGLLESYDDFDRELDERQQDYYRHHLRNRSDYPYDEPFLDYSSHEDIIDAYHHRFDEEILKNHTIKNRNPRPKPNFANGTTWYVDDDGGADFTKIQDAIDAADDGDTIFVYNGIYYENVIVDKSIILQGEDKETTIIDGGTGWYSELLIRVIVDHVTISGFKFQNNLDDAIAIYSQYNNVVDNLIVDTEGAIVCFEDNNVIANNRILLSTVHKIYPPWIRIMSKNNKILNNKIDQGCIVIMGPYFPNYVNNNTVNGKMVLYLEGKQNLTLTDAGQIILVNCDNITIKGFLSSGSLGIELINSNFCNLINNHIDNCSIGVLSWNSDYNLIRNNSVSGSWDVGAGIWLFDSHNNFMFDNLISGTNGGIGTHNSNSNQILSNFTGVLRFEIQ